jgi:hypothetical protein
MMAPGGEDDPRRGKEDISHRDRKDHKDLAVLNFGRATSVFGNGDLNFRPRLMKAPRGEDHPRRGRQDISHRDHKEHKNLAVFYFNRRPPLATVASSRFAHYLDGPFSLLEHRSSRARLS